jgi:flagellar hook-associated protein 3 FlgL
MRISTQFLFESGANAIRRGQSDAAKLQQQITTGRRVLSPSDDPIAASRALVVSQSKDLTGQYATNQGYATDGLGQAESVLAEVSNLLSDAKAASVNARNGALGNADRATLAQDLRSKFAQLLGLANTRDGSGGYLFAGYKETTPPFSGTLGAVTYDGDAGQRELRVSASRTIPSNFDGSKIFDPNAGGVFDTFGKLITALEKPVVTPADQTQLSADIGTALTQLDGALDTVLTARTQTGAWLRELDSLSALTQDQATAQAAELSQLEDLDYAEAISRFSQQMTMLEAAQKSYVQMTQLSVFKFI